MSCSVSSQTRPGKESREELWEQGKPELLEVAGPSTVQWQLLMPKPSARPVQGCPDLQQFLGGTSPGLWAVGLQQGLRLPEPGPAAELGCPSPELSSALPESPESCVHHRLALAAQGWDQGLGTGPVLIRLPGAGQGPFSRLCE